MKQWFGAWLCMVLGAVLIVGGLSSNGGADAVAEAPTCQVQTIGVAPVPCPTGTISVTEVTHQLGHPLSLPAGGWQVDIASPNCTDTTGATVATTLTIADGGTAATGPLFVFTDPGHTTSCSYTLAEHPVAGFAAAFAPPSPVTITFSGAQATSSISVTVTNTSDAPTPTPTPTPTPSSRSTSKTATPTPSASASAAPILATTGTRKPIRSSLYLGVALFGLGLVLLVAGRRQRRRAGPTV